MEVKNEVKEMKAAAESPAESSSKQPWVVMESLPYGGDNDGTLPMDLGGGLPAPVGLLLQKAHQQQEPNKPPTSSSLADGKKPETHEASILMWFPVFSSQRKASPAQAVKIQNVSCCFSMCEGLHKKLGNFHILML